MSIKDLQPKMGKVELVAIVSNKEEPRTFNKEGRSGRVCNAKIKDETGEISLTLWNDDVDKVNLGDKIQIKNGFVSEWQGELQLSTGKFGSLEILEKSATLPEIVNKEETKPQKTLQSDELDEEIDEELASDEEEVL